MKCFGEFRVGDGSDRAPFPLVSLPDTGTHQPKCRIFKCAPIALPYPATPFLRLRVAAVRFL